MGMTTSCSGKQARAVNAPPEMFNQNADKTLDGAENGAVEHDGAVFLPVLPA